MDYTLSKQALSDKFGFDDDDLVMLFSVFCESARTNLEKLHTAIQTIDYPTIYISSHNIKGSAGNMLLDEVYEIARIIETASKDEIEIDYITHYEKLNNIFNNLTLI